MSKWKEYLRIVRAKLRQFTHRTWSDPAELLDQKSGLFILMYHSISNESNGAYNYSIHEDNLESHLQYLTEHHQVVPLTGVLEGDSTLPDDELAFALTFDDGFVSHVNTVLPLLNRYQAPATFFLAPDLIGRSSRTFMNWKDVQYLSSHDLVDIGCHGQTHFDLTALDSEDVRTELDQSRNWIESQIGRRLVSFAYPFGGVNDRIRNLVRRSGFHYAFKANMAKNPSYEERHTLGRISVEKSNQHLQELLWELTHHTPLARITDPGTPRQN